MEFGKRHDTTDFCLHQLVTDLLQGSYGETGVMDFGKTCYGAVANLLQTCCRLSFDGKASSKTSLPVSIKLAENPFNNGRGVAV